MEYTKLGSTGMDVSRICLGCMGFGDAERWVHKWVLDDEKSRPIIQKALELGINFFDTANVYSIGRSGEILGGALRAVTRTSRSCACSSATHPQEASRSQACRRC